MEGLGSETIHQPQNTSCVCSFLFLHRKKKCQHKRGFLGTRYLTLPEMEKRTLKGKRRDNSICRCYFPSHLSENFIAVKDIHKKPQLITDTICQPLQQILLYIKHNDILKCSCFRTPKTVLLELSKKFLPCLFEFLGLSSAVYFSSCIFLFFFAGNCSFMP